MIHINLNMIFYTHVKHSPTKTIYIKYYLKKKKKNSNNNKNCVNTVHYFDHDQLLFFWFIKLEQDINWCVWAHLLACLMPEIFVCLLCNVYR